MTVAATATATTTTMRTATTTTTTGTRRYHRVIYGAIAEKFATPPPPSLTSGRAWLLWSVFSRRGLMGVFSDRVSQNAAATHESWTILRYNYCNYFDNNIVRQPTVPTTMRSSSLYRPCRPLSVRYTTIRCSPSRFLIPSVGYPNRTRRRRSIVIFVCYMVLRRLKIFRS